MSPHTQAHPAAARLGTVAEQQHHHHQPAPHPERPGTSKSLEVIKGAELNCTDWLNNELYVLYPSRPPLERCGYGEQSSFRNYFDKIFKVYVIAVWVEVKWTHIHSSQRRVFGPPRFNRFSISSAIQAVVHKQAHHRLILVGVGFSLTNLQFVSLVGNEEALQCVIDRAERLKMLWTSWADDFVEEVICCCSHCHFWERQPAMKTNWPFQICVNSQGSLSAPSTW